MADLTEPMRDRLKALMQLMETMVPFDAIFADRAGDPKAISSGSISESGLALLAQDTYRQLNQGTVERSEKVLDMMSHCEPFAGRWPETVAALKSSFRWE